MGCASSREDEELLDSLQPQFHALQLTRSEVRKLLRLFKTVGTQHHRFISLKELMDFLNAGEAMFRDRVFSIFDEEATGKVDFRAFVLALWNYCTLNQATLELFAFDLYDTDSNGLLAASEVHDMLLDLYGAELHTNPTAKAVAAALRHMCKEDPIDLPHFQRFVQYHQQLLFPAFQLQNELRRRFMGTRFWGSAAERRVRLCEGRFVPVADLIRLSLNEKAQASELQYLAGPSHRIDDNAQFVLASAGTINARHMRAAASKTTTAPDPPSVAKRRLTDESALSTSEQDQHRGSDKSAASVGTAAVRRGSKSAATDLGHSAGSQNDAHVLISTSFEGKSQQQRRRHSMFAAVPDRPAVHEDRGSVEHHRRNSSHEVAPIITQGALDASLDQPVGRRGSIKPAGQKRQRRHSLSTLDEIPSAARAAAAAVAIAEVRSRLEYEASHPSDAHAERAPWKGRRTTF